MILQRGHPLLRQKALPVPSGKIQTAKIQTVLKKMGETLEPIADGVALAAPQIGLPWRIFIVSGKLFPDAEGKKGKDLIFINPELKRVSKKEIVADESCLSTRWLYGLVRRAEKATVTASDERGKKFTRHGAGLLAQIFQHEIDHLNGVLFLDKAKNVREIKPDES